MNVLNILCSVEELLCEERNAGTGCGADPQLGPVVRIALA